MRTPILIAALSWASVAGAAGWTQPEGAHYFKAWNRLLIGESAFLTDGSVAPLEGKFVDAALGVYFEYGFVEGTTLIIHGTPVGWAQFTSDQPEGAGVTEDETTYMGAMSVGVRRSLFRSDGLVVAAELQVGFAPPVGDGVIGAGALDPEDCGGDVPCTYVYRATTEHARILGELQVGVPLSGGWWLSGSAGGVNMIGIAGAVRGMAQVGWASSFGLVVDIHGTAHLPLVDVDENDVAGSGVTSYVGFGPGISYWFSDHWGVSLGAEGVAFASANLAAASLSLGVEHK